MTERVADFVWRFLADRGVRDVFLVTGGNAMHLNDALAQEKRISPICVHHEQAAAMAAEGYSRVDLFPGVLCTTSGPGAINALGGLYGAYVDSLPVICIAGQSKRELLRAAQEPEAVRGLRQLGVQEADAVTMARPVTKYASTVMEPFQIMYELEKAWYFATAARPGPVFLDIPLDVQAAKIETGLLPRFLPESPKHPPLSCRCAQIIELLKKAKRPVLLVGEGIREGGAVDEFRNLASKLAIPVVTAWMPDLYTPDLPYYAGRMGTLGTRAGNFAVQNSDFILAIGSRLSVPQVSFNWEHFAREAYVVSVNADAAELSKPIAVADETLWAEPKEFISAFIEEWGCRGSAQKKEWQEWLTWCRRRVERYPEVLPEIRKPAKEGIHPYYFIEKLFQLLDKDAFVACGNAASACVAFQAAPLKLGQRLVSNASAGAMGHDLPCAIGAALARKGKPVICLAGDGSIMMNIQELQTLASLKLPVGIFIMNNGGYLSIRTTQRSYFGRLIGEGPTSGVTLPDFTKIAEAFGMPSYKLEVSNFPEALGEILGNKGPWLCDVRLNPEIGFEPRISSKVLPDGRMVSAPLEDMFPFLERGEFLSNMIVSPPKEDKL